MSFRAPSGGAAHHVGDVCAGKDDLQFVGVRASGADLELEPCGPGGVVIGEFADEGEEAFRQCGVAALRGVSLAEALKVPCGEGTAGIDGVSRDGCAGPGDFPVLGALRLRLSCDAVEIDGDPH